MPEKKIFDIILMALTVAYIITKAILNYKFNDNFGSIEDGWNDYFAGN